MEHEWYFISISLPHFSFLFILSSYMTCLQQFSLPLPPQVCPLRPLPFPSSHPFISPSEKSRPRENINQTQQATIEPGPCSHTEAGCANPVGGKGYKQAKVWGSPSSHCQECHKDIKLCSHNIYVEDLGQTHTGSLISVSLLESWSVDSVGLVYQNFKERTLL